MKKVILMLSAILHGQFAFAELSSISDEELSSVSGQGGLELSGEISFNEHGGPIQNAYWGDCTDSKRCGARLSYQTRDCSLTSDPNCGGGWFVLDNIRGKFSFQGLTLRVRTIDGSSDFGGDEVAFGNRDVLEIGLPGEITFENVSFTYATANRGRPTDSSGQIYSDFQQTDIFGIEMDGQVTMQGKLLVFPTGNP